MTEPAAGGGDAGRASGGDPGGAIARGRDQRPGFHLSAPRGWLNDPNGPIHRNGLYHLFFQHNPVAPVWAPAVTWGHAVSADLLDWRHVEHALEPSPGTGDEGGCWSGCVVDDDGVPTAVYSGLAPAGAGAAENVCLARGDADLLRWRKDPRNPVLAGGPRELELTAFRDPFVWREDGAWQMVMGAGIAGVGAILAYESRDLVEWTYRGVLVSGAEIGGAVGTGTIWECPQLLRIGPRDVLIVSVWDGAPSHTLAIVGRRAAGRFAVEHTDCFDHGADFYAPATMSDPAGRRLAWGWAWEGRAEEAAREQDWAGVLTFPRELTVTPQGRLGIAPAAELAALRGRPETFGRRRLGPSHPVVRPSARGDRLELAARFAAGGRGLVSLTLCATPDGEEQTIVAWDPHASRLTVDRSRSSRDRRAYGGVHGGRVPSGDGSLDLRVLVDSSIVEVYANGTFALTERIHPTRADATGIALTARAGEAVLERLSVWPLERPGAAGRPAP